MKINPDNVSYQMNENLRLFIIYVFLLVKLSSVPTIFQLNPPPKKNSDSTLDDFVDACPLNTIQMC